MKLILRLVNFVLLATLCHAKSLVTNNRLACGSAKYEYRLFAAPSTGAQPAILLLHGAGDDAENFIQPWIKLAGKEGIVLIAPQLSRDPRFEDIAIPTFRCILGDAGKRAAIDPNRIYVFGYSAGGYLAYDAAMLDSQHYAAVAVFGMIIAPDYVSIVDHAVRKTPVPIYLGHRDQYHSVEQVDQTRVLLLRHGFPVHYVVLPGHDHNYYTIYDKINSDAWEFLSQYRLPQ